MTLPLEYLLTAVLPTSVLPQLHVASYPERVHSVIIGDNAYEFLLNTQQIVLLSSMLVHLRVPRAAFLVGLCAYGNIRRPKLDSVSASIISVPSMALCEYPR